MRGFTSKRRNNIMVTLHEVITLLVSLQISISSLQTHNVTSWGRRRHLARKLSLSSKRRSRNVTEMAADVVAVVIWRESSVSGGSGAVQMFLRWQQRKP